MIHKVGSEVKLLPSMVNRTSVSGARAGSTRKRFGVTTSCSSKSSSTTTELSARRLRIRHGKIASKYPDGKARL